MRILMATHYWRPHRGGIETVTWEQAHRLTQRGHQVAVVAARLQGDPAFSQVDGFSVYRVPAGNFLEERRGIPYPLYSYRLLPLLARLVPANDVAFIHNHTYLGSVAATLVARAHRLPIVLLQHSPFVEYRFPWSVVERAADLVLGRYTLRSATRLMATSEHTKRYVQGFDPGRGVEVLALGVDTQRFTPVGSIAEKLRIRAELGFPPESFVVLTVRRLVFRNGLDALLAAAAELRGHEDIVIAIGGSGPERELMERIIRREGLNNVRLMGFVPDEVLPDVYRAADAFVLPSRTGEGFGLVILEAFSSGIPAIATRGGGQEEVICGGSTGLLVPPGSPAALAEAILALHASPQRTAMGEAARAKALDMDWERSVDHLERVLSQVAGER